MAKDRYSKVRVIDSHTGGEPTRVVTEGGPDLGNGSLPERVEVFRQKFDWFRSAVVNEPRGSDITVGALLCEPVDPLCTAGVIFFNNVGYLGMCGHGTIGLLVTLAYAGRIEPGEHRIETSVGAITAILHEGAEEVTVYNVPSYRLAANVSLKTPEFGVVRGDIAWGGNWFFLVREHTHKVALGNVRALTEFTTQIRHALEANGITGAHGAAIDHIELFAPSQEHGVNSRSFTLCPGNAFDRSPCGTGTSAKLACLYADGEIDEGQIWRQESVVGSIFEGSIRVRDGQVYPNIKGSAYVTAEADLIFDERDPFCMGITT